MKTKFIYALLAFTLLLSACSTDLDVTGNWKETMVVYGLLDQSHDTQYVKINKAFLGEGNAYQYAQQKDSVQFANSLTVQLQRIKNGNPLGAPIQLQPNGTIPKDAGIFYSADQTYAIYSYPSIGANKLNADSQYELSILNNETGTQATATTSLVGDLSISKPLASTASFYFVSALSVNYPFMVEWKSTANGRLYQLFIRFNYMEYIDNNGDLVVDDSVTKKLDWYFTEQRTSSTAGGETMNVTFAGKNYLKYIGNTIQDSPNVIRRKALKTDLYVTGGSDDLSTFIDVNKPSTGIIQEKPEFTNINNGLGIFTSRVTAIMSRNLEATTLDTLACGQYTRNLRFENSAGILPACH